MKKKSCWIVCWQARDKKLYSCITDCGAGGLSSAVGEMGAEIGAEVSLEKSSFEACWNASLGDMDVGKSGENDIFSS